MFPRWTYLIYTYYNIAIVDNPFYFALKHHLNSRELFKGLEGAGSFESKR